MYSLQPALALMCLCPPTLDVEGCEDRGQAHHFLHMQGQLPVEPIGVGPSSGGCAERCRARYPATPLQSARSAAARRFASHWVMMQVHRYKPSGNRAHSIAGRRTERTSTGLKCMLNPGAPQHVDLKRSLQPSAKCKRNANGSNCLSPVIQAHQRRE